MTSALAAGRLPLGLAGWLHRQRARAAALARKRRTHAALADLDAYLVRDIGLGDGPPRVRATRPLPGEL